MNKNLSEKIINGMMAAANRGARIGAPRIMDNPTKADAVRYAVNLREQGHKYITIIAILKEERKVSISLGSLVRLIKENAQK